MILLGGDALFYRKDKVLVKIVSLLYFFFCNSLVLINFFIKTLLTHFQLNPK